jgi:ATP-dependent DNA helicase RecG
MRTLDEIRSLLGQLDGSTADELEDEDLEFKPWPDSYRDLTSILKENVVCLANARGGEIVLGVRDRVRTRKEAIVGIGDFDGRLLRRSVYDGTDPHILVDLEELAEPEGNVLVVHVPRGIPPHTTSEGLGKVRIGKDCVPLTGGLLTRLLSETGAVDRSAQVMDGLGLQELDPQAIQALRHVIGREAQNAELARLNEADLLSAIHLVSDSQVTMAGLLLVGRADAIARYVPQHEVTFLRYRSATRYDQRRDLRGNLLDVLETIEQLISVHNRVRTIQETGFGQLELPDLSWEVAREAVLNAVTHRDYFLREGVMVSLFSDRLEITSPGGFIGGVTPDNVLRHPPVHRNELLARSFQAIGLVNRVGVGVDRIYRGLLEAGKAIPRYRADATHVTLVVPLQTDPSFAIFVATERRRGRELELDDLLILKALTTSSSVNRWAAAQILQSNDDDAAQALASLRDRGYVVVRGRGRGATYSLRRDLADRLRGRAAVDADLALDKEAVALRIEALLRERGTLSNSDIQRFSGYNRTQVYRLVKELEKEGKARVVGRGRAARILPPDNGTSTNASIAT